MRRIDNRSGVLTEACVLLALAGALGFAMQSALSLAAWGAGAIALALVYWRLPRRGRATWRDR